MADHHAIGKLVSGPPARKLVEKALLVGSDLSSPFKIFDSAAGTGMVIESILEDSSIDLTGATLLAGDISAEMISSVQAKIDKDEKWKNVTAKVIDAQDTKLASNSFTHVFINFGIGVFPKPIDALNECMRILRPGGVLAFTNYRSLEWITDAQAAIKLIPNAPDMVNPMTLMTMSGKWDTAEWIDDKLQELGFVEPKSERFDFVSEFPTAWSFINVVTQTAAPLFVANWSEEFKKENWPKFPKIYETSLEDKYGKGKPIPYPNSVIVTVAKKPL